VLHVNLQVVHALREVTSGQAIAVLEDMLCYLSFNNTRFSITVIRMIMVIENSYCNFAIKAGLCVCQDMY